MILFIVEIILILIFNYENKIKKLNRELKFKIKNNIEIEKIKSIKSENYYIKQLNEKLKEINKIDGMTKIYNKQAICNEINTFLKKKIPFSILMFDIDKFKNINDQIGHVCGDKCIKKLALLSKSSVRVDDFVGRYGGDEFIIILPKVNSKYVLEIAEKLRKNVENNIEPTKFTITVGVSSYSGGIATFDDIFSAVDLSLYKGKESGRNQVQMGENI